VKTSRLVVFLGVAAIVVGAVIDASAQTGRQGPGGGDPAQRGGGRGGPQGDPRSKGERPSVNQLELMIEELREDLHLQPQQQAAWENFVDKVRAIADDATRARNRAQREPDMSGMQRIEYVVDIARNRYTAIEDGADAAKALYRTLSPEQQNMGDRRIANVITIASQSGMMMGMPVGGIPRDRPPRAPQ
jgi:hypothetical protein